MRAIVVMAHSRPLSLRRALESIEQLMEREHWFLVVSVDPGAHDQTEVERVARSVDWPASRLRVTVAEEHLGLVEHFGRCGSLTSEFDVVVLVEDDLELAPSALQWVAAALDTYGADPLVAGISLNSLWFNGFSHRRFEPIPDGTDAFFVRLPWYQGMAFTPAWWRIWTAPADMDVPMHPSFDAFGEQEWYPDVARRLAASGRSFVFPRASHAVNHGEAGVHFVNRSSWFQTPLERAWRPHTLRPACDSTARYDQFMEIDADVVSRHSEIPDDVTVDLTATRPLPLSGQVLTVRPTRSANRSWGVTRRPLEANLLHDQPGTGISLCDAREIRPGRRAAMITTAVLDAHERHHKAPSLRRDLAAWLAHRRGWTP